MVARKILQALNFETEEAVDGKDALEACKRKMPEAILLDWNMPVMDGLEFLHELRKLPGGGRRESCSARRKTTWSTSSKP